MDFQPGSTFETHHQIISSGTDEVRAKRESSLCNESVKRHFWSNLTKNCMSESATRRGSSEARTEFTPSFATTKFATALNSPDWTGFYSLILPIYCMNSRSTKMCQSLKRPTRLAFNRWYCQSTVLMYCRSTKLCQSLKYTPAPSRPPGTKPDPTSCQHRDRNLTGSDLSLACRGRN